MRVVVRLSGCLCLLAVGAVGLSPASAGATLLGSAQIDQNLTDFGAACNAPPCVYVQKRLPGTQVRAPFSGVIHKWRLVSTGVYTYQLVVMHKKSNGKYKNVGESSLGPAPGAGEYVFSANLAINKGDYIGLKGGGAAGIDNPGAKTLWFDPGVEFPDARRPTTTGAGEWQFNATLRRH
jgi:hypothetical protein